MDYIDSQLIYVFRQLWVCMDQTRKEFFTLDDFDFMGKTVLLRVDLNSPIHPLTSEIMSDTRFKSHLPTIEKLRNARVVIMAHQSRPGKSDFTSLFQHSRRLERLLGRRVKFIDSLYGNSALDAIKRMESGDILMLENTRFYSEDVVLDPGERETIENSNLVKNLSSVCDYFVNDAFPAIHRAQTSLTGFTHSLPNVAGLLIQKETGALNSFLKGDRSRNLAILAGAKIEDSITVADSFLKKDIVGKIVVGGVVANAFLWASGKKIGKKNEEFIKHNNKNYEKYLKVCRELLDKFPEQIIMPVDYVLNPSRLRIDLDENIPDDQIVADIGLNSIARFSEEIRKAESLFINGPMGMYEIEEYSSGTFEILKEVAASGAMKIAGGGHTISAIEALGVENRIDHMSTGGGALISYLSGEPMPVLESLRESKRYFEKVI
ncbi:MAG: phosphoglycerate kinase [Cuniculiplasma sp.]